MHFIKSVFLTFIYLVIAGCVPNSQKAEVRYSSKTYTVQNSFGKHKYKPEQTYSLKTKDKKGRASYYGGKFNGRKTASCIVYDESQLLAAHTTAVLPSVAKITRTDTGKHIHVILVDRGPFAKGRICDLSVSAAAALDGKKEGHIPIKIDILPEHSRILAKHWKKYLHKRLPDSLFKHIHSAKGLKLYLAK